jgi:hypothetical protein
MIRPKKKSKFLEEVTKSNFCSILNPKTCLPFWMGVSANAMESNACYRVRYINRVSKHQSVTKNSIDFENIGDKDIGNDRFSPNLIRQIILMISLFFSNPIMDNPPLKNS